jgi:hypothetical protein
MRLRQSSNLSGRKYDMARNKYVYVIMAHNTQHKSTYISRICSNKKKAENEVKYIQDIMKGEPIVYWTSRERVS